MGEEGLCWKCKERFEAKGKPLMDAWGVDPWVHCHHEPKERKICWCEASRNLQSKYIIVENCKVELNFCPECGRKL